MVFSTLDAKRDVNKENFSPTWQKYHKMFRLTEDDLKPILASSVTTQPQIHKVNDEMTSVQTLRSLKLLGVHLVPMT